LDTNQARATPIRATLTGPSNGCWWTSGPTGRRLPLAQLTGVSISLFTRRARRKCRPDLGFVRRWTLWVRKRCKRLATCSGNPCFRRRCKREESGDAMALELEILVRQRLLASPEVQSLVGTSIFPVG